MLKLKRLCTLSMVAGAALGASGLRAQSTTEGAIAGTVEDPSNAVVPKATVTVHNNGTNAEHQLTADESGYFKAPLLEPGTYTVTIAAPGFAGYKADNVTVQVGQLTELMPKLSTGTQETTVQVSEDTTVLNLESPDLSTVLTRQAIDNIPVQNRRWSALALLTPAVVPDASGFGLISVRGLSTLLNEVEIDGADDNQAYYSEERGRTREAYSTSENAVREFEVNTGVYSAQYGRAAGGVINSVTRSGTNEFHGELLFDDLDRGFGGIPPGTTFTTLTPTGAVSTPYKPKDLRKIYGGSVGGYILKDKLFWFYTYDQQTRINPAIAKAGVPGTFFAQPDAALPSGTCNLATGYLTGSTTTNKNYALDAQACTLAAREKLTSYAAGATAYNAGLALLNTDLGQVPRAGYQEINTPKVDYQLNAKNRLSVLYHRLRWDAPGDVQTTASASYARDTFGNDFVKLDYGLTKLESQISNSLSNEVLFQYSRELDDETQQPFTPFTTANLFGTGPSGPNVPQVSVDGSTGFTLGSPYYSYRLALPDERKWQVGDTLYYQLKNHTIRIGADLVHNNDLINNTYESNGAFSYTYIGNLIADLASKGGAGTCNTAGSSAATATVSAVGTYKCWGSFYQGFGNPEFQIATLDQGYFIQDNYKMTPRVTLELGVRYDYESLPQPYAPYQVNLNLAAVPNASEANRPSDKNNIGPRVGFSADVFGTGKTVLRGGFGLYYGRMLNGTILNTYLNTGSPAGQFTTASIKPTAANAPSFPSIIASGSAATPSAYYFSKGYQNPLVEEIDMQLQQNLGKGTIFQVSYLGALGRELPNFLDVNLDPTTEQNVTVTVSDTTGRSPLANGSTFVVPTYTSFRNKAFSTITEDISNINSSYHGFVAEIQNRSLHGLTFDANYTWSHALDFNQNATATTSAENWLDPNAPARSNYGISQFNVGNRFVGYVLYNIPGTSDKKVLGALTNGWSINDTFQMQNGLPYSATLQSTYNSANAIQPYWNGAGGATYVPAIGRNTFESPRAIVDDARLQRQITLHEHYALQLRADVYNVANHQNISSGNLSTNVFALASTGANSGTATFQSAFNSRTSANTSGFLYTPREIQIGARLQF
ncbi:MAG: carboxypeptidase regulatory-like domain-containing protein [Janthinobacterium lividum]